MSFSLGGGSSSGSSGGSSSGNGHFVGLDALIKQEKATAKGLADFARATKLASDSVRTLAAAGRSIPSTGTPSAPSPGEKVPAPSGTGPRETAAAAPSGDGAGFLASRLREAVQSAQAPLVGFGAHIDQVFDRVGGTIVESMRRIDARMKFPTFDGAISRVKRSLGDAFRAGFGLAPKGAKDAIGSIASIDKAIRELTGEVKSLVTALKTIVPSMAPAAPLVAQMAGQVAKTITVSERLKSVWKSLKGLAPPPPNLGPPAGQRPGVGRAVPLGAKAPPVPRNPVPQSFSTRASSGASQAAEAVKRSVGQLAQYLEGMAVKGDHAFGVLTMRGRIAGDVIRSAGKALLIFPAVAPVTLASTIALAARGFVGFGQAVFRARSLLSSLGDVAGKTFSTLFGSTSGASSAVLGLSKALLRIGSLGTLGRAANDAGKLRTGLASVSPAAASATQSVKTLGREIAVALGVFGAIYKITSAVKDFVVGGVKGASDLNEAVSAAGITFGTFTGEVEAQAGKLSKAYGISKKSQMEVAAGFGEMAKGAGQSKEQAAAFANTFTQLAADLNSRSNLAGGFEEAASKIQSALAGQAEPLRKFGVNLTEANVEAYALANGMARSKDAISDQAKMSARAALIQRGLASAIGDLERTSDSAANQFRKAGGGVDNFGVAIGQILLPAVTSGTAAFNDLLDTVVEVFDNHKATFESWGNAAKVAMDSVGIAVRNMGSVFTIGWLKVKEFSFNTLSFIEVLPQNFNIFADYLANNWTKLLSDAMNRAVAIFQNGGTYIGELWHRLGEMLSDPTKGFTYPKWDGFFAGFKAEAAALPTFIKPQLMSMQKEIDDEWSKVLAKEAKRSEALKKTAKPPPEFDPIDPLDKAKKKKKEKPLAELAEKNTKEAYSSITRHFFGGNSSDSKATASNTARIARATERSNRLLEMQRAMSITTLEVMGLN